MTAENKPQQTKRESMKKLVSMKQEGHVAELLLKVRQAKSKIDDVWKIVHKIEDEQDERVRREDMEYEQELERAKTESTSAEVVSTPEFSPTEVVDKSPIEASTHTAEPKKAPVIDATPTATAQPVAEEAPIKQPRTEDIKPVVQSSSEAQPAPKAPVDAVADTKEAASSVKSTAVKEPAPAKKEEPKAEAATRVKTFDADSTPNRPSFLSANQRPRPVYVPQQRPVYNPPNGTSRPMGGARPPYGSQSGRPPMQQRPFNRPLGAGPRPAGAKSGGFGAPDFTPAKPTRSFDPKKDFTKQGDDKKSMSKRTLIRKGFVSDGFGEDDRMGSRKLRAKKKQNGSQQAHKVTHAFITTENLTVKMLSEQIGIPAQIIIKHLMNLGQMVAINSVVDFETMALVAIELGVELELKIDKTKEEVMFASHSEEVEDPEKMQERPPIVTVMGHVDHGKTSLLDALKKTNVVKGEAGGITQHIGAYTVTLNGKKITFIDTPGHEAFTAMRARGAQVTDIAVIVVAADDGIMPQTIEAINHAKAANVPIVVAVNKIDKPTANIDRIKQQLTEHDIVPEEWGGDSPVVGVSAKAGIGLDDLLENILIISELKELKANPDAKARGTVIEARLDKGRGPVASVIIQNGTLRVGDTVVSGMTYGHIRAMTDDKGRNVKEAGPSMAVSVLGLQDVPASGALIYVAEDEKLAKQVVIERSNKVKTEQMNTGAVKVSLEDVMSKISEGQLKSLNLVIKADVQGSVEALKDSLIKLSNDEVRVQVIHSGAGAINKSDTMLAEASNAIIIGFNVRPDSESKIIAEHAGIDIRSYSIIYEVIDDVTAAVKGMLAPKFKEEILGRAEIRSVFKITGSGMIAGSYVLDGKLVRKAKLRILRDNVVVGEGSIESLKRFKDDVKEVATGYECGLSIAGFDGFKEGDTLEAFNVEQLPV